MRKLLTFLIALGVIVFAIVSPVSAQGFNGGGFNMGLGPFAGGSPTTIFTTALPSSNTGNNGLSLRENVTTTGNSVGHISVGITAHGGALQVDHVSYCIAATAPNCAAAPVELTYTGQGTSGGHGFSITTGVTAVSDFVAFAPTGTSVIVIFDINAASPGDVAFAGSVPGFQYYISPGTAASWNQQNVTGYTVGTAGQDFGLVLIQTQ